MKQTECEFCGKKFRYPCRLLRHLSAKRKCVPAAVGVANDAEKPYTCRFCGEQFTAATNMYRHMRESCKIAPNSRDGPRIIEQIRANRRQEQHEGGQSQANQELQNRIATLENQIAEMTVVVRGMINSRQRSTQQVTNAIKQLAVQQKYMIMSQNRTPVSPNTQNRILAKKLRATPISRANKLTFQQLQPLQANQFTFGAPVQVKRPQRTPQTIQQAQLPTNPPNFVPILQQPKQQK